LPSTLFQCNAVNIYNLVYHSFFNFVYAESKKEAAQNRTASLCISIFYK